MKIGIVACLVASFAMSAGCVVKAHPRHHPHRHHHPKRHYAPDVEAPATEPPASPFTPPEAE